MTDYRISFQLYSARNFPPVEAQLETLAAIGFDAVEPYRGAYGDDPTGLRRMLDAVGLACPSAHIGLADLDADLAAVVETARILGLETVVSPFLPPDQRPDDADGWQALGARLQEHALALRKEGLKYAWHNHAFEYATLSDGSRPIEHLLAGPDVMWEADIGWIARADCDVKAELERFPGKLAAFHVKDVAPEGVTEDDGWTDVGAGIIDWRALLPTIESSGTDLLVLEHDAPSDWRSFAENSFRFLTGLVGK